MWWARNWKGVALFASLGLIWLVREWDALKKDNALHTQPRPVPDT